MANKLISQGVGVMCFTDIGIKEAIKLILCEVGYHIFSSYHLQ